MKKLFSLVILVKYVIKLSTVFMILLFVTVNLLVTMYIPEIPEFSLKAEWIFPWKKNVCVGTRTKRGFAANTEQHIFNYNIFTCILKRIAHHHRHNIYENVFIYWDLHIIIYFDEDRALSSSKYLWKYVNVSHFRMYFQEDSALSSQKYLWKCVNLLGYTI